MMHRFGTLVCLVLAASIAVSVAQVHSVNYIWNTNPECLGPSSGYAEFTSLVSSNNVTTCSIYNSTYDVLYLSIGSENDATCNSTGQNTYWLYTNTQCDAGTGIPMIFNTTCNPRATAGTGAPQPPQAIPVGAPAVPVGTQPSTVPLSGNKRASQQAPVAAGDQATGSQQFICDDSQYVMQPYVQIIGPGCGGAANVPTTIGSPSAGSIATWTLTWSNQQGCVAVYNASTINFGNGGLSVQYALVENACEAGSTNYSINFYSDSSCTNQIGNLTFDDGCTGFQATCFTTNSTAPNGAQPLAPSAVPTLPPALPPQAQTPEAIFNPVFSPFFTPQDPEPTPSAAGTVTASAFLIIAASVLAYVL